MLAGAFVEVPMGGTATRAEINCLARTCLTWTADGELSAEDRALVLERLERAEQRGAERAPARSPWQTSP